MAADMSAFCAAFAAAGPALAIGLPESPAAAIALLLTILAVTYALLTVFIRVGVPSPGRLPGPDADGPEDDPRDAEWPSETAPESPDGPEETEEVPREPLAIQAVRVRDSVLSLGDPASRVMAAFQPSENETAPLVQRETDGRAGYVSRTYRVGRRVVTFVLEREDPDAPLTLARIELGP